MNCHEIVLADQIIWNENVRKQLTCKQDSKLVSRHRDNSRLCGAWQCSLRLQFQLNHRFIHLPQFTGAQSVVDPPGHSVQSPNWNWLRSRNWWHPSVSQSVLSQQPRRRQLSSSITRVFLLETGKIDRNTYVSGSSLSVCPAVRSACLHMICRGPLCVLQEWCV